MVMTLRQQQLLLTALVITAGIATLLTSSAVGAYLFFSAQLDNHFDVPGFSLLIFGVIIAPIMFVWIVWRLAGRFARQTFDPLFTSLGLTASSYLRRGRQYHGTYHGRAVDMFILPTQIQQLSTGLVIAGASNASLPVYAGHRLELFMDGASHTRAVISGVHNSFPVNQATQLSLRLGQQLVQGAVLRLMKPTMPSVTVPLTDSKLEGCAATTIDGNWLTQALTVNAVREPLNRLMTIRKYAYSSNLQIQPDYYALQGRIDKRYITTELLHGWLDDLSQLRDAIETAPAPTITDQASQAEFNTRKNRNALAKKAMLGVIVFFAVLILFIGAAIALIMWYEFGR